MPTDSRAHAGRHGEACVTDAVVDVARSCSWASAAGEVAHIPQLWLVMTALVAVAVAVILMSLINVLPSGSPVPSLTVCHEWDSPSCVSSCWGTARLGRGTLRGHQDNKARCADSLHSFLGLAHTKFSLYLEGILETSLKKKISLHPFYR